MPLKAEQSSFVLNELTVSGLRQAYAQKQYSIAEVVDLYLRRIDQVDRAGPMLRSVLEVNPEAMAIAHRLDQDLAAGKSHGPLHGVPVVLKDVVDTADRMHTTAGSLALLGSRAPRDAFIVERLRAAGAVILAKTNMSEWSNCRSTNGTSGWSARGGLTRNPYVLDRTACGSSSGSAAAVSAYLSLLVIGSVTD
jgi:amidase